MAETPNEDLSGKHDELRACQVDAASLAALLMVYGSTFYTLCDLTTGVYTPDMNDAPRSADCLMEFMALNRDVRDLALNQSAEKLAETWDKLHFVTTRAVEVCKELQASYASSQVTEMLVEK